MEQQNKDLNIVSSTVLILVFVDDTRGEQNKDLSLVLRTVCLNPCFRG